jgi:phosphohistidine phosphatase
VKLFLLRHGEAEPYGRGSADQSRALVAAGIKDVKRVAAIIEPVEAVFCSPYLRARQTADLVLPATGVKSVKLNDGLTPDSSVQALILWLASLDYDRVLLVAHNPLLSQLACELSGQPGGVSLSTANLACLDVLDWMPGGADLVRIS